jgi:hypothetical protein
MKKLFGFFFILTSLLTAFAQQEDSLFVIISDDTVHIWNTAAYENCGCLFRMDAVVSNDTIFVTETDTASDWAYCMCYFDMCASITGLQSGIYFVEVFRYMPLFYPDTTFYIGYTSFTFGGSALGFSSQSFQSECYDITEINGGEKYPKEYTLGQNYPNPFNPSTTIRYQIPDRSFVTLKIYDLLGREVAALVNEEKPAGTYELTWNAEGLPSGVYFYQLRTGSFTGTGKMVFLK